MTTEQLLKANEIQKKIDRFTFLVEKSINQKCEWITFAWGNGSNRETVCDDMETIEIIRTILIAQNNKRLAEAKKELSEL